MVDNRHKSSKIYNQKKEDFSPFFSIIVQNSASMADTSTFSLLISHNSSLLSAPNPQFALERITDSEMTRQDCP